MNVTLKLSLSNSCLFFLVFPRNGKAAPASHEDEEIFMTGQFQKTLAELDEDLEGKHRPSCLDVSAGARLLLPLLRPLGLDDWRAGVILLSGIGAKETMAREP